MCLCLYFSVCVLKRVRCWERLFVFSLVVYRRSLGIRDSYIDLVVAEAFLHLVEQAAVSQLTEGRQVIVGCRGHQLHLGINTGWELERRIMNTPAKGFQHGTVALWVFYITKGDTYVRRELNLELQPGTVVSNQPEVSRFSLQVNTSPGNFQTLLEPSGT